MNLKTSLVTLLVCFLLVFLAAVSFPGKIVAAVSAEQEDLVPNTQYAVTIRERTIINVTGSYPDKLVDIGQCIQEWLEKNPKARIVMMSPIHDRYDRSGKWLEKTSNQSVEEVVIIYTKK
jgi:hypothetical protein